MTTLDLSPDCIASPMRLDLAIIESVMLYPDDAAARQRWMDATKTVEGVQRADTMPADMLRDAFRRAAVTPPLADLRQAASERMAHGWLAGEVLRRAVAQGRDGGRVVLGGLKREKRDEEIAPGIVADLAVILRQFRTGKDAHATPDARTFHKRIWPQFRSVAHLWAAYLTSRENGPDVFPCTPARLPVFLALALHYQTWGEKIETGKGPLLRSGETVSIPDLPGMPDVAIEYEARARN